MSEIVNPLSACADCCMVYGSTGWCDVVIPTDVWLIIGPSKSQGGLLCFNCIARRLELWDLHDVPFSVASGPFKRDRETTCEECSKTAFRAQRCLDHFVTPDETGIDVYREHP